MRKQQVSFSVDPYIIEIFKQEASSRGISVSEFVYQAMLRIVLRNCPDRLGIVDPETGRICEIIRREDDPDFFDEIKNPDFSKSKKYTSLDEFEKDLTIEDK